MAQDINELKVRLFDTEETLKATIQNFEAFVNIAAESVGYEGNSIEDLVKHLQDRSAKTQE